MSPETTIVLDETSAHLEDAIKAFAPVLVFRRAAGFRCASSLAAEELHQTLADHSLLGRAIYVAPSYAGFTALLAASQHAASLRGVLLLDPSHPRQGEEALQILVDAPPSSELDRLRSFLSGFGPVWEDSCRAVSRIEGLGDLPILVLAGGRFDLVGDLPESVVAQLMKSRHAMLSEYCALSSRASFEIVRSAGHDISHQAPDAVLAAVKHLLKWAETEPNQ